MSARQPYSPILSGQGELHGHSEVMGGGGIAAAGQEWLVGLTLVVSREGQQARQRVVGHERHLQR